jgi:hypothetical protein
MIPGKIIKFMEQRANMAFAGTRDRNLVPCGFRVSAWRVATDGRTLTALIPGPLVDRLIASLEDNGQFAITLEEHPSHETYQLKGQYVGRRPVQPEDLELVERMRERFLKSIRSEIPVDVPEAYLTSVAVPTPDIAIDVDVREVYLQTPGPGAGARLYPPVEAQAT